MHFQKPTIHYQSLLPFLLLMLSPLTHATFHPHFYLFWIPSNETLIPPHEQHGSHFIRAPLPKPITLKAARASELIPKLNLPSQPRWQNLNENTWKTFFNNLRDKSTDSTQAAFVSPRVSTQFSRNEFFWDQAFISLGFGLYGHKAFNTLGGLDCFYDQQHPDGYIPREIKPDGHDSRFFPGQSLVMLVTDPPIKNQQGKDIYNLYLQEEDEIFQDHPEKWTQYQAFLDTLTRQKNGFIHLYGSENNSNPPLAAHAEWRHYLLSRDKARLARVHPVLVAHTQWLETKRQLTDGELAGLFWQRPMGSGMDNLPSTWINNQRIQSDPWNELLQTYMPWLMKEDYVKLMKEQKHFASFDISAQMKLHYEAMANISRILGKEEPAETYKEKASTLKKKINECLWDEEKGFYFNVYFECQRKSLEFTLSAYWALYANIASTSQAERMLGYLQDPKYFATTMPFPSLATSDMAYHEHGNYWRGGVWPPLVYITIKGLINYVGELPKAWDIAINATTKYLDLLAKNMASPALSECDENNQECPAKGNWLPIYEYNSPSDGGPGQRSDVAPDKPERYAKANFVGWGGLGPIGLLQEVALGIDVRETEIVWHHHLADEYSIENLSIGSGSISLSGNGAERFSVDHYQSLPPSITTLRVILKDENASQTLIPLKRNDNH